MMGYMLVEDTAGPTDQERGLGFLAIAESKGSDLPALALGWYCIHGRHGYPVDKIMARHLLEKFLNCENASKHGPIQCKKIARKMLDQLRGSIDVGCGIVVLNQ